MSPTCIKTEVSYFIVSLTGTAAASWADRPGTALKRVSPPWKTPAGRRGPRQHCRKPRRPAGGSAVNPAAAANPATTQQVAAPPLNWKKKPNGPAVGVPLCAFRVIANDPGRQYQIRRLYDPCRGDRWLSPGQPADTYVGNELEHKQTLDDGRPPVFKVMVADGLHHL